MPFSVYLLECSDKSLYCGYAKDLKARLEAHNLGRASKYTRARLPAKLVYLEEIGSKGKALKRESEIKALKRKHKLALVAKAFCRKR